MAPVLFQMKVWLREGLSPARGHTASSFALTGQWLGFQVLLLTGCLCQPKGNTCFSFCKQKTDFVSVNMALRTGSFRVFGGKDRRRLESAASRWVLRQGGLVPEPVLGLCKSTLVSGPGDPRIN